ncbi:hypothetical protein I3760_03G102900 [Carya illinoinensis]|nr:hypothetical protein I3760_03G102900 [Carya illinoinensis]
MLLVTLLCVLFLLPSLVFGECTCDTENEERDKDQALRYKLVAIASILVAGAIGVSIPILGKFIPALRPETDIFFVIKAFATGVILATGFIHVLPDAFETLTSPCLSENPWGNFPFTGFVAMVSAIGSLMVDAFATSYYSHRSKVQHGTGDEEKVGGHDEGHEGHMDVHTHATNGHTHGSVALFQNSESSELLRHRVISQLFYLRMAEGTLVIQHLNEFNTIINQLASVGIEFDDEVRALIALAQLPKSWEAMRTAVSNSYGKTKMKYQDIRDHILSEEVRRRDTGEASTSSSTLNLETRGRGASRSSNRGRSKSRRGRSKSRSGKQVQCWNCRKIGHFKNNCKEAKKKNEHDSINATTEDLQDALLLSVDNQIESWVLDSGASFHTTADREIMQNYVTGDFGKVYLADGEALEIEGMGDVPINLLNGSAWLLQKVSELGIVVHSVIIGISLGASETPKTIKPLVAALTFHQFFEGMGLGRCISQAKFKSRAIAIMVVFYSLTTPVGIAIGTGISNVYDDNSPTALIVEGIFNAASAGILIYMALVDLLAADFMSPRMQSKLSLQIIVNISLLLGAGCMSLLAKWA